MSSLQPYAPCSFCLISQARTALLETHEDGGFKRRDSTYRKWVGKDKEFPAEGELALALFRKHA